MRSYLDFEKPVADLQGKVQELRALEKEGDAVAIGEEIARLEAKAAQALAEIYGKLSPWQKTQVARHPDRPHTSDYAPPADRGLHAAGRRPQVRRGRGDRRRPRLLPRQAGGAHRP